MVTSAVNHQLSLILGVNNTFSERKRKGKILNCTENGSESFLENRYTENSVSCILENGGEKKKGKLKIKLDM